MRLNTHLRSSVDALFLASAILFVLSAAAAVWSAADGYAALMRFAALAMGIVFIGIMVSLSGQGAAPSVWIAASLLCTLAAVLVSLNYLLLGNLYSEVAAGTLIVLIPLSTVGASVAGKQHRPFILYLTGIGLLVATLALVITRERSAWVALAAGLLVGACAHRFSDIVPAFGRPRRTGLLVVVGSLVSVGVLVSIVLLVGWLSFTTGIDPLSRVRDLMDNSPYGRLAVWRDALTMIQDFPFIGSGLGQTGMVLSTYVYLYHVPFIFQVYNLFLQIAVEQGLPGLIGFAGMVAAAGWQLLAVQRNNPSSALRWTSTATLVSLVALLVHGLFDAGAYISALCGILFLPFAFAQSLPYALTGHASVRPALPERMSPRGIYLGAVVPLVALLVVVLVADLVPAFHANLGAVEQTRSELRIFRWPSWYNQDDVRRSVAIDLSGPLRHYRLALQADPENITAHRRLGQIALSQGDYPTARSHLETAYRLNPKQRVSCLLLGEVYAIAGEPHRAVEVWESGNTDPHKLELRQAWYVHRGANQEARRLDEALLLFKQRLRHRLSFVHRHHTQMQVQPA